VRQDIAVEQTALLQQRSTALTRSPAAIERPSMALPMALVLAIPLLALNLRPAVTSMGSVLASVRSDIGLSAVLASAVVAAPVWCFAAGGALAWSLRVRWGTTKAVTLSLIALATSLAFRVTAGPYLLLFGTITACLAIAVLGTLLPAIVHAAPARGWALLTGCYVAALGSGSGLGALITPQVANRTTWQIGASAWALLAVAAWLVWRVAARQLPPSGLAPARRTSPMTLSPAGTAWALTVHFGLVSGFTFSIMGWLPSMLIDRSDVAPSTVAWLFTVATALGVPIALRVPHWARQSPSQSGLAVALTAPSMVAVAGMLLAPALAPWLWAVGIGLGMPAVALALTAISLRAEAATDTAAALSSMVQGIGYAIAGATALGTGLLHGYTHTWEWPLLALLAVLCGQMLTGMSAGLPVIIRSGPRTVPSRPHPEQPPPRPVPTPPIIIPEPRQGD
jgi:CP family cyanate transporter-like MFS transporter